MKRRPKKKNVVKLKQLEWQKKENAADASKKIVDQDLHERWTTLQGLAADMFLPRAEDKVVIQVAAASEEVAIQGEVVTKGVPEATAGVDMGTAIAIVVAAMEIEGADMVTETVAEIMGIAEVVMVTETAVEESEIEIAAPMGAHGVVKVGA